ncbi:hypothetical protein ACL03H_07735 [Saccharopolyspora sp. MS10]|uniref:hypothetical protein n=1 Tax=Saccharopolyspora sp. MS10 TaxID=3385973 RepID=UPI00399FFE9C
MSVLVRFVLPDGSHSIHATTEPPEQWGAGRVAEALCGELVTVPVGARRVRPPMDSYCDDCAEICAARYPLAPYRLPSEGPM